LLTILKLYNVRCKTMTAKQTAFPRAASSRDADKFVVRLPDGLRELIEKIGKDRHTSMNTVFVTTMIKMVNEEGNEFVEQNLAVGDEAGWTPSIGMVVEIKGDPENEGNAVTVIEGFEPDGKGGLLAKLAGYEGHFFFQALRPHRVM